MTALQPLLWQNRIVGYDAAVAVDSLLANPQNAWQHSAVQQQALLGALSGVGWWDAVKVNVQTGHVVDGHARIILALRHRQHTVPVLYLSLSEAEERIALAEANAIARLATPEQDAMDELLRDIHADGLLADMPLLAPMLDQLAQQVHAIPSMGPLPTLEHVLTPEVLDRAEQPIDRAVEDFRLPPIRVDETRQQLTTLAGHRTAQHRQQPSRPVQWYDQEGLLEGTVLDYGAGLDQHEYDRFDPAYSPDYRILKRLYRTVMCNYVLNVIPLEHSRYELLMTLRGLLLPGGSALIAIWQRDSQDAITHRGFQCGWTRNQWERMFFHVFSSVTRREDAPFWCFVLKDDLQQRSLPW